MTTISSSDSDRGQQLNPDRDADEIINSGEWRPYANRIVTNGVWKIYYCKYTKRLVWYTFEQAVKIVEHQKSVDEKRLSELNEMFKPLPELNEEEKKKNQKLYWTRIRKKINDRQHEPRVSALELGRVD